MRLLTRFFQRLLVFCLGGLSVWLIVFIVFDTADQRLPWVFAVCLTYGLAAYVILPNIVRLSLKVLHRGLIPRYTITADGLPGDPVNFVLIGTLQQLHDAFEIAGWSKADSLGMASSLRMARAFLMNSAYLTAPFSTFYLFGRRQDVGFQEPIDGSPRKRHHIRFWALSLTHSSEDMSEASFWLKTDKPSTDERVLWVGAGTRDTGLSLTWLTFKITHATDSDTNAERDYIVNELKERCVIGEVAWHQSGSRLVTGKVNHYITDGEVAVAKLISRENTVAPFAG
ncbi:LssY C-terminal domain-containing protein [Rhizobium grahamii]|uniref:LssY-like C-terminal domain-containing protein n=1 Tax=Rhizobium grahamii TaxID=1120045 RepID=A0A370KIY3_9HYPH|nr:LssY C-terminal domain-containing protein [Rhizobium grahamii]RDJ05853.1 hypothetical protein B5K06_24540 [Rhizobium grahamii]